MTAANMRWWAFTYGPAMFHTCLGVSTAWYSHDMRREDINMIAGRFGISHASLTFSSMPVNVPSSPTCQQE